MLFDEFIFKCPKCGAEFDGDSTELDGTICPHCGEWIRPIIVEKVLEGIL